MAFTLTDAPADVPTKTSGGFVLTDAPAPAFDPSEGMSVPDVMMATYSRAVRNLGIAGAQRALEIASGGNMIIPGLDPITAKWVAQMRSDLDRTVASDRARDAPLLARPGADEGDFAGNVIPSLALPGAGGVKAAAAIGGLLGLMQPTTGSESPAVNAGVGTVLGAAGQQFGEHVIAPVARKLWSWVPEAWKDAAGIRAAAPPPAPALPPDVAARQAAITAQGATPTEAQLTRDPNDWYAAAELAKREGAPKAAAAANADAQAQALAKQIPAMRTGSETSTYGQAEAARKAVHAYEVDAKNVASGTYDAAAKAPGSEQPFDAKSFFERIQQPLAEFEDVIPGPVKTRLQELQAGQLADKGEMPAASGAAPRPFTVGEAANLYQLVNKRMGTGEAAPAGAAIKAALSDAAGNLEGDSGSAMQLFKDATQQWRTVAQIVDAKPATATSTFANMTEAKPEALQQLWTSGKPAEINQLYTLAQENHPEAAKAIHDSLLDYLHGAATQQANGQFSGAMLGKAMDRVGPERMQAVLSPEEYAQLQQTRFAAELMTTPPAGSAINTSNTGSTIANLARKAAHGVSTLGTGMLGEFLGGPHMPFPGIGAGIGMGVGAATSAIGEHLAARSAAARMQAMLNPDLEALAWRLSGQMPPVPMFNQEAGALGRGLLPAAVAQPLGVLMGQR